MGAQSLKAFFANVSQNMPNERPDSQRQGGHQQQALLISRGGAKSATTGGESSSAGCAPAPNLHPQGGERAHQQEALEHPQGGERAHQQEALQRQISNHRGARELSSRRGAKIEHLSAQICNHRWGRGAPEGEHDTLPRGGATKPGTYMSEVPGPVPPSPLRARSPLSGALPSHMVRSPLGA